MSDVEKEWFEIGDTVSIRVRVHRTWWEKHVRRIPPKYEYRKFRITALADSHEMSVKLQRYDRDSIPQPVFTGEGIIRNPQLTETTHDSVHG